MYVTKANTANWNVLAHIHAEDIFAPDGASPVAHQPAGYDRLAANWAYYKVYKAHCTIRLLGYAATDSPLFLSLVLYRGNEGLTARTMTQCQEAASKHCKYMFLPIGSGGYSMKKLSMWWHAAKDSVTEPDSLMTAFGSSPLATATFYSGFQDMAASGTGGDTVYALVRCKYWVRVAGPALPTTDAS